MNVSNVLLKTIEVQHRFQEAKLKSDLNILKSDGKNDVQVTLASTMFVKMDVYNLDSSNRESLSIPNWRWGPTLSQATFG